MAFSSTASKRSSLRGRLNAASSISRYQFLVYLQDEASPFFSSDVVKIFQGLALNVFTMCIYQQVLREYAAATDERAAVSALNQRWIQIMEKIVFEIPEEILISLKETPSELSRDIRMLAAVKLYEMGKLSSGRAAQLAGVPRVSFLQSLSRYGVSLFELSTEDLKRDYENA